MKLTVVTTAGELQVSDHYEGSLKEALELGADIQWFEFVLGDGTTTAVNRDHIVRIDLH